MATLLKVYDFPEEEFWKMLSKDKTLPDNTPLLDYDDEPVNNYLREGDTKFRLLAAEYNIEDDNWKSPINAKVKCKLASWVSYCICRDAQEGKALPLYPNMQENKVDWWETKKNDYLDEYNGCKITASDIAEEIPDDGSVNFNLSVAEIYRS